MATPQQLQEAIRRADAVGDAASVRALGAELRRQQQTTTPQKPTSFWQGVAEEVGKAGNNAGRIIGQVNPFLAGIQALSDLTGLGKKYTPKAQYQANRQAIAQAAAASPYRGSTAGRVVGGIIGTLPLLAAPGGAVAQGVMSGGLLTDNMDDKAGLVRDLVLGGVGGKAGDVIGKRVVAPVAERVGRTKVVRKPVELAANALRKMGAPVSTLPLPKFTAADRAVQKAGPLDDVTRNLTDAQRLNLPYALADASPELRTLAGSVARKSTDARALAERTFVPRARGQAERAVEAIDTHLAPITDIEQRAADIIEGGKPVYDPLYQQAYAGPVVTSPKIERILSSPAGREAVGKANTIAADEFRDPRALGFALDDTGNVVLHGPPDDAMRAIIPARQNAEAAQQAYSAAVARQRASLTPSQHAKEVAQAEQAFHAAQSELEAAQKAFAASPHGGTVQDAVGYTPQSLDYVKGGFDDMLEPSRNPITGKLVLDRRGRAINAQKNTLLSELDALNPDYQAARQAYGQYAGQADALGQGFHLLPKTNTPIRNFNRLLERNQAYDAALAPGQEGLARVPELQRGYATAMADRVDNVRLSHNPYDAIHGSPAQQQKVQALFPEGAEEFARVHGLEADMGKTYAETLGGSQTQPRVEADRQFDAMGPVADIAIASVTGNPMSLARAALQKVADAKRVGMGKAKADAMAPALFNTDTSVALDYLQQLAAKQAEQRMRQEAYRRAGGLLSFPLAVATVAGAQSGF